MVRPKCKCFALKEEHKNSNEVIASYKGYGPVFGAGCDIYIDDGQPQQGGGYTQSFTHTSRELFGSNKDESEDHEYRILDYEVFAIIIS